MLNLSATDRIFQALGDPTRRAIVDRLSHGATSVSALAEPMGLTLAAIVQHLQVLEHSRIVRTKKVGRVRTAQLDPQGLSLASRWLDERRRAWERNFDHLDDLLRKAKRS